MVQFFRRAAPLLAAFFLLACQARAAKVSKVVLVIEENHAFSQIIGFKGCPYINELADHGCLLTRSHAVRHPSLPNYLALFAGSTYGQDGDYCPPQGSPFSGPNLGSLLRARGLSFIGYSQGLPEAGDTVCKTRSADGAKDYTRNHNPWVAFANIPPDTNQPFSAFPADYAKLPDLSIVVPDEQHDMHSASRAQGDLWLKDKLSGYARWAMRHHGLLVVTWDEDNGVHGNRIATIFYGQDVRVGKVSQWTNHYGVLKTLCGLFGVAAPAHARKALPIRGIFKTL